MENTTNLELFGYRELVMAGDIMHWFKDHSYPEEFDTSGVHLEFNPTSGNVFLANDDGQVLMMNGDSLEMFYTCPECGGEGFKNEIEHEDGCELAKDWGKDD